MTPPKVQIEVPAFTRAMKWLTAFFGAVWLTQALVGRGGSVDPMGPFSWLVLIPSRVEHGEVWRLLTYALVHDPGGIQSILWTALTLWFFGGAMQARWGLRRLALYMAGAVVAGAAVFMVVGAAYVPFWTQRAWSPVAATAMLTGAWAMSQGSQPVSLFALLTLTGHQCAVLFGAIIAVGFFVTRSPESVLGLAGYFVGVVLGNAPAARPPRRRQDSGPKLRVIRGGVDPRDLPN